MKPACSTRIPGGSRNEFFLVSQQIEGLQPNTVYHYRVVADNGNPDGPAIGEDMTVTTRGDELRRSPTGTCRDPSAPIAPGSWSAHPTPVAIR